jgi:hypothetical protein
MLAVRVRVGSSTISVIEDIKLSPASVRMANPCGERIYCEIVRVPRRVELAQAVLKVPFLRWRAVQLSDSFQSKSLSGLAGSGVFERTHATRKDSFAIAYPLILCTNRRSVG